MEYIATYQANLSQLLSPANLLSVVNDLIRSKEDVITQIVKDRWKKGLRPTGDIIGLYRSYTYKQEKLARNPLARGNVDLIDTGALSKGLQLYKVLNQGFTIFSRDYKAELIAKKYGLDVYGLSREETLQLFEALEAEAVQIIINQLW